MATVDVTFTALPSHVRTARLVALAVARRSGVAEDLLDEVRLAVGEACSRAVGVHAAVAPDQPISMRLSDDDDCFTVEVVDKGPLDDDATAVAFATLESDPTADAFDDDMALDHVSSGFGLVVIGGLVEDFDVSGGADETRVTMAWPTMPAASAG
jgi:anti-sigma regulatory factor (Ser/Thr protein kinase)